jgi:hypothetical protein
MCRAYVAYTGHIRNVYKILVIEPKEKRPCGYRMILKYILKK